MRVAVAVRYGRQGPQCIFARLGDEADAMARAARSGDVTYPDIAKSMTKRFRIAVSQYTVGAHLRGQCRCSRIRPRSSP